ncbi:MAG: hypothetical protein KDC44_12215, partial [Phaeodactylibacter sp.]|nr:hypothetical protein [Phaeodactylibacter sp.]
MKEHLNGLSPEAFTRVTFMVLPMIEEKLNDKIEHLQKKQLPTQADPLKDIDECLPFDKSTIRQALELLSPLKQLQAFVAELEDRQEILQSELL